MTRIAAKLLALMLTASIYQAILAPSTGVNCRKGGIR